MTFRMNASPTLGKILLPAVAAICLLPLLTHGQDVVTLKDGSKRQGAIVGVDGTNIRLATEVQDRGRVQTTVPLAQVASVAMNPPADLLAAETDWQGGDAAAAVAKLEPLVKGFSGLPAAWVQRATLLLIDTLLETGKTDQAEAALVAFQTAYPESADSTALIRAKIAVARNNFVGARPLLEPIVQQAKDTNLADTTQSIKFGQAYYLMGQIRESTGDLPGALEDYLYASTIFFADATTASRAQSRADILTNEKNIVVP
jgi:hypothetical protein